MSTVASQITGVSIAYWTVCSGADQRKHQSSVSLAFVRGIHRRPENSPHKGSATRKMFPFDDVIMGCISLTKGPHCGALMFSLLLVWMTCWVNRQIANGLRRCDDHVTSLSCCTWEQSNFWIFENLIPSQWNPMDKAVSLDHSLTEKHYSLMVAMIYIYIYIYICIYTYICSYIHDIMINSWIFLWNIFSKISSLSQSKECGVSFYLKSTKRAVTMCECHVCHHDVIKWNHFPRYWPFVWGIHRSPVDSLAKSSDSELWCFLWCASEQTVQ